MAAGSVGGHCSSTQPLQCFSWCNVDAIQEQWARLPTTLTPSSPWAAYLAAVYHEPVSELAQFDVSSLGFLTMPKTPAAALRMGVPFDTACDNLTTATCGDCTGWLQELSSPAVLMAATRGLPTSPLRLPRWVWKTYQRSRRAAPWPWDPRRAHAAQLETMLQVRILFLQDSSSARIVMDQDRYVGLIRSPPTAWPPRPFANDTWVEVLREPDCREGANGSSSHDQSTMSGQCGTISGCWFYPLMKSAHTAAQTPSAKGRHIPEAAVCLDSSHHTGDSASHRPYSRGSGVWVNTGRTLVFKTRSLARDALKRPGDSDDNMWALEAHARGYDTIQVPRPAQGALPVASSSPLAYRDLGPRPFIHISPSSLSQLLVGPFGPPEMVVTRAPCLRGVAIRGPCPPAGVELRTGVDASLPCRCDDAASPFVNCGDSPVGWWRPPLRAAAASLGRPGFRRPGLHKARSPADRPGPSRPGAGRAPHSPQLGTADMHKRRGAHARAVATERSSSSSSSSSSSGSGVGRAGRAELHRIRRGTDDDRSDSGRRNALRRGLGDSPSDAMHATDVGACHRSGREVDGIDVLVAMHAEGARWIDSLAAADPRVCVWLCSTTAAPVAVESGGSSTSLGTEAVGGAGKLRTISAHQIKFEVPNTGREAQCYVQHMLRMAADPRRMAAVTIFMQVCELHASTRGFDASPPALRGSPRPDTLGRCARTAAHRRSAGRNVSTRCATPCPTSPPPQSMLAAASSPSAPFPSICHMEKRGCSTTAAHRRSCLA